MKRIAFAALLISACFQPWTVDGLYLCGGGCPEGMTCDDGVCCRPNGTPECPTLVPDSGVCATGVAPKTYYADEDGDGYGNAAVMRVACAKPLMGKWTDRSGDCDDTSAGAHPGGTEICDGHDNDCNGSIDEGQTNVTTYYRDVDGDGYGVATDTLMACMCPTCTPPGYAAVAGDCAPTEPMRHPGAAELCNGLDDDCNGPADDNVSVGTGAPCSDGGMGECAAGTVQCVSGALACKSTKSPSREVCDGFDNNCNGTTDEQPDCGGPNQLLVAGAAVTGARILNLTAATTAAPTSCFGKAFGSGEGWTQPAGPWSGSSDSFHMFYAEAPGNTVWDLSRANLKLHLQFTTTMLRQNATNPWNQFNQPVVLLCNADATKFTRLRPDPTSFLSTDPTANVNTDMPLAGGNGWLLAQPNADLTQVKRVEILIQPSNNAAMVPSFTVTFNNSTGFKP